MNDEELQRELLSPLGPAPSSAPSDPDAALQAELLRPAAPAGPARAANGRVYVRSPLGNLGTVDEAELPTLGKGFSLASEEEVAAELEREEYGDGGSQIAAGLEGAAQGATLGGYGLVSSALAGDEYDRERRLRAQHNPGTALAGEVVGAVAPALLSGGSSAAASVARTLPSALAARAAPKLVDLGTKLAGALGERAAAWAASRAGQVGMRGLALGIEGASDQAVRTVLDDAANGDVDVTAERMIDAAWTGFAAGAALELGAGAFSALGKGVVAGAKAARAGLPASLPDAAGEAAYKAAVGRTDVRSQRIAQRYGGTAEVGKTLLEKGLVQAGDTVDEIAERMPAAREAAGQRLSALLGEVEGGTASRQAIWDRIEGEVLADLDQAGKRDIADAVRAKLANSGIEDVLNASPVVKRGGEQVDRTMTLRELHELRRSIDSRPDLKWGAAGPNGVDLTTDAMRDVRRVVESSFEDAADDFARSVGVDDFAARLKQAKREYSHIALAADQAEEGVMRRAANNRMGLNDVLAGVGGAAAAGASTDSPEAAALGMVAGLGSRYMRSRFESTAASLLYRASGELRPATMLGRLADDAARTQEAIVKHADDTVRNVYELPQKRLLAKSALTLGGTSVQRAMDRAVALQDPRSPESQSFAASVRHLANDDPALAQALAAKVQARAAFIASKVPPPLDPSDPLRATPGQLDGATARKSQRYVQAALDPKAALERLSQGAGSAEDLETLRALTPRLYDVYVKRVKQRLLKQKRPPTARERQRLAYATGVPMSASDSPSAVAWYQRMSAPSNNPNLAPTQPPASSASNNDDQMYATRTDRVLSGE